jgi:hypothetical protein
MAVLTDLPSSTSTTAGSLAIGAWCVYSGMPGVAYCVISKVAAEVTFATFGPAADCTVTKYGSAVVVTPIDAPASVALSW